jgi:hypothetical protein
MKTVNNMGTLMIKMYFYVDCVFAIHMSLGQYFFSSPRPEYSEKILNAPRIINIVIKFANFYLTDSKLVI